MSGDRKRNRQGGRKWKKRNEWAMRKEVHGDKTQRGRAVNCHPSVSLLLGCCYVRDECTHTDYLRSVELITWGVRACVCVHVCVGTCVWTYNGDGSQLHFTHKDTDTHIVRIAYIKTSWFQRAQIIIPGCKVARGFPMHWQLAYSYTSTIQVWWHACIQ